VLIDTSFDFRTDTPVGQDPDAYSPTLRQYHKLLWSKALPSGAVFDLDDTTPGAYLHHGSALGEFFLSSDSVIPSFTRWDKAKHITDLFPEKEHEDFRTIGYTIGAMMVYPARQIERKWTINQARGMVPEIADRLDLTLECIRRHYGGQPSSLDEFDRTLARYSTFFALFKDFRGYVDFFLLQDLVTDDYSTVRFFMPFDNFKAPSWPQDADTYREYRHLSIEFIKARNLRIGAYSARVA
jgi:hypothetical protein